MVWLLVGGICLLVGTIGVVIIVGLCLPIDHTATSRLVLPAPPAEVWAVLLDAETHPAWRSGLKRIDVTTAEDGKPMWTEQTRHGPVAMVLEEIDEPVMFRMRIADERLPFGGTWTYRLAPRDGGTEVRITEDGAVYQPIFRFVSRFVMGHHGTMDTYLGDLARRFGSDAAPIHVSS